MITSSLVVIGVRPGNPKGIRDWTDLAHPGVGRALPRSQDLAAACAGTSTPSTVPGCEQRRIEGRARPEAAREPAGQRPGERRDHGRLGPAEHGHLPARHRRRDCHLRERAAPPAQADRRGGSLCDAARHALDRRTGRDRRCLGRAPRQPRDRRGVPRPFCAPRNRSASCPTTASGRSTPRSTPTRPAPAARRTRSP